MLLAACSLTPELDTLCNLMSHYPCRFVEQGLLYSSQHHAALQRHVLCVEDQESLRGQLSGLRLAAFVADGSILPRCVCDLSQLGPNSSVCQLGWVSTYRSEGCLSRGLLFSCRCGVCQATHSLVLAQGTRSVLLLQSFSNQLCWR